MAGELQPEKVQTSFHISGGRSLGEVLGCIISFSLLRNLSPGGIERTLLWFSALSLSRFSWRYLSQKEFHVLLVGFSCLLTGKFLLQQDWCLKSKTVASGERDGVTDLGYLFPFQIITVRIPSSSWHQEFLEDIWQQWLQPQFLIFFPTCSCQLGHRWKRLKKLLATHNVASQVTGVSKAVPLSSLFPVFIIFVHSFAPLPSR